MTLGGMRERKKGAFWWLERPRCWSHCCCLQTRVRVMGQPEYLRNPNKKKGPVRIPQLLINHLAAPLQIFLQIFFSAEIRVFLLETLRSLDNNISSDGCCYCFLQSNKNPPKCCCLLCSSFYLSPHRVGSSRCKVFFLFLHLHTLRNENVGVKWCTVTASLGLYILYVVVSQ